MVGNKKEKYPISEIKAMRLTGMTLKQIANYYDIKENSLYKYLKRRGILFSKLPLKCEYCGKTFKPNEIHRIFCSSTCAYFHRLEQVAKYRNEYYKKYGNKYPDFTINNADVAYENSLYLLNRKAETSYCPICNSSDCYVLRGEVLCSKCHIIID